ncbi:hypothetical protein DFH09DRAFT_1088892 [Mycena vulgaris]|nr:hypothetical protein DFH09DRAFT_1088892 [Mycena vulgaris]
MWAIRETFKEKLFEVVQTPPINCVMYHGMPQSLQNITQDIQVSQFSSEALCRPWASTSASCLLVELVLLVSYFSTLGFSLKLASVSLTLCGELELHLFLRLVWDSKHTVSAELVGPPALPSTPTDNPDYIELVDYSSVYPFDYVFIGIFFDAGPGGPATKLPTKKLPTSRSVPQRLILCFANLSIIKSISNPQRLHDTLNEALRGASKLRGVNRFRGGPLVLHVHAPYTAVQLREHQQTIWAVVHSSSLCTSTTDCAYTVAIHRVPVTTTSTNRSLAEKLRWSNEGIGALADVMGMRDLCSLNGLRKRWEALQQGVPQETFLMLMLLNADVARHFLRQGVFLYGSHCRKRLCYILFYLILRPADVPPSSSNSTTILSKPRFHPVCVTFTSYRLAV